MSTHARRHAPANSASQPGSRPVRRVGTVPVPVATEGGPRNAATPTGPPPAGHRWTFLTNHAHVLILLDRDPTLVLRQVAALIGITERAVQRIIADLEEGGFIEREKVGRKNHYHVLKDRPLRHPVEQHRSIGQLLDLIRDR